MPLNSNPQSLPFPRPSKSSKDNLDLLADCLEGVRESIDLRPGLTIDTRLELEESLALAEAALRRAHFEAKLG